jgi:hypothetical protein
MLMKGNGVTGFMRGFSVFELGMEVSLMRAKNGLRFTRRATYDEQKNLVLGLIIFSLRRW